MWELRKTTKGGYWRVRAWKQHNVVRCETCGRRRLIVLGVTTDGSEPVQTCLRCFIQALRWQRRVNRGHH